MHAATLEIWASPRESRAHISRKWFPNVWESSVHNSMVHSEWTVCVPEPLRVARPVGCAYALRLGVAVGA